MRTRTETRHVEFITDSDATLISRDGPDGQYSSRREGAAYVQDWAPYTGFELKTKAKEYPYRIAFVVELSGDIAPLQQCTDVTFECKHSG